MNRNMFVFASYKGKPAIFDTVARVYYFGFKSKKECLARIAALNAGK